MPYTFWERLADTPWWVCLLFPYLIRMGFLATKARVVTIKRMLFLPIIFTAISIFSLSYIIHWNILNVAIVIMASLVGTILGRLQFQFLKIKAIKNTNQVLIPGSYNFIILILVAFSIKYYSGYEITIDPQIFQQTKYVRLFLLVYGLSLGLFIGRSYRTVSCVKNGPFVDSKVSALH